MKDELTRRINELAHKEKAEGLTEEEKAPAMQLLIDRYLPGAPDCPPQAMARTAMWRLDVTEMSVKANEE